jgi:hypothetical protein
MTRSEEPKARWETYADEIVGKDSAEMEAAVAEYAKKRHVGSSAQNQEELARWKEGNAEIARQYQWVKPEEYADIDARQGKILTHDQFITTLRDKCKLTCFYREMGHPQKLALWVQKNGMTQPEVGCWVQRPFMIEYEVMRFDEKGVPLDSRFRGWRTCLLQMILKKMLTEQQVNKAFGPATGPSSQRYNQTLHSIRKNS